MSFEAAGLQAASSEQASFHYEVAGNKARKATSQQLRPGLHCIYPPVVPASDYQGLGV
jgi:hypothetical protein